MPVDTPFIKNPEYKDYEMDTVVTLKEEEFKPEVATIVNYNSRKHCNPAVFGVMTFAVTTILVNLSTIGLFPFDTMCIFLGIFCGALGQLFSGIICYHDNNLFGCALLATFGGYWLSYATTILQADMFPKRVILTPLTSSSMGFFNGIFCVLVLMFWIATLGMKGIAMIQLSVGGACMTFFWYAVYAFTEAHWTKIIAAVCGICTGSIAMWGSGGDMVNEFWGMQLVPVSIPLFDFSKLLKAIKKVAYENRKAAAEEP